jgi:hypothetical protein
LTRREGAALVAAMLERNRNVRKNALISFKAAQSPASKKASKNNGQNWTVCCRVSNLKKSTR